jgi:uncharacterized RDD family membrane protein YckC
VSTPTSLVSGEGVAYDLSRAGLGSRTIAALIDVGLQLVALVVLFLLDAAVAGSATVDSDGLTAVFLVETVFVLGGYPIVMEWLTRGRTVGKICLGLRVLRDDGGPIGFRQALVRGLAGLILEKPGLIAPVGTVIGMTTLAASPQDKRIGDMMAGTFVVNERGGPTRSAAPQAYLVAPPLAGWVAALDLSRLDDRLALALRQFIARAHELSPAARHAVGEQLRARVLAAVAPAPPPGAPTPWVLTAVLAERRRRADWSAWSAAQPAPPRGPAPGYPAPARPGGGGDFALPG